MNIKTLIGMSSYFLSTLPDFRNQYIIIIVCNCLIKKRKSILTNPLPQIITITLKHKFFCDKFSTLCLRLMTQNYCFL